MSSPWRRHHTEFDGAAFQFQISFYWSLTDKSCHNQLAHLAKAVPNKRSSVLVLSPARNNRCVAETNLHAFFHGCLWSIGRTIITDTLKGHAKKSYTIK